MALRLRAALLSDESVERLFVRAWSVTLDALAEAFTEKLLESGLDLGHVNFTTSDDEADELTIVGA